MAVTIDSDVTMTMTIGNDGKDGDAYGDDDDGDDDGSSLCQYPQSGFLIQCTPYLV